MLLLLVIIDKTFENYWWVTGNMLIKPNNGHKNSVLECLQII